MVPARTSEPPCFSVIDMPAVMPAFVGGHRQLGVVDAAGQQRLVDRGQLGVVAQRGDDGVGHRDRADVAGLGASTPTSWRRARRGRRRGRRPTARACRPWPTATRHQLVVGGVVLDLVDAVAVAVVGVQDRLVAVGELTPALRLRAARRARRAR